TRPATGAARSLIPIGTPANGRRSPGPIASAAARAPSVSTSVKAFTCVSTASIRRSEASTTSRAASSPERTSAASSGARRKSRSSVHGWPVSKTRADYRLCGNELAPEIGHARALLVVAQPLEQLLGEREVVGAQLRAVVDDRDGTLRRLRVA